MFHPREELDEIISWNGVEGTCIHELVDPYDSRIVGGGDRGEVVHEGEYCGCRRSVSTRDVRY